MTSDDADEALCDVCTLHLKHSSQRRHVGHGGAKSITSVHVWPCTWYPPGLILVGEIDRILVIYPDDDDQILERSFVLVHKVVPGGE